MQGVGARRGERNYSEQPSYGLFQVANKMRLINEAKCYVLMTHSLRLC